MALHKLTLGTLAFVASLAAASSAAADVRVTMHDGLVTIVAKDATLRQILAEWARVGQTRIVDADRIAGGPVTIDLVDVPEKQAIEILLRSVNGYLLVARQTLVPNASQFDRILVMPATAQPRSLAGGSSIPPALPQPQTRFQLPQAPQDIDDQAPIPVMVPVPSGGANMPPQIPNPNTPASNPNIPAMMATPPPASPNASVPAVPFGSSTPGVVAKPPQPVQSAPGTVPTPPGRF